MATSPTTDDHGAEADSAVRSGKGRAEQLRLVADSTVVEFVSGPLAEAFTARSAGAVEITAGVASSAEMAVLVSQRLADLALGPYLGAGPGLGLVSEPIMRARLVVLAASGAVPPGPASGWPWLFDPSGTDSGSDVGRLLRTLSVPERRVRV